MVWLLLWFSFGLFFSRVLFFKGEYFTHQGGWSVSGFARGVLDRNHFSFLFIRYHGEANAHASVHHQLRKIQFGKLLIGVTVLVHHIENTFDQLITDHLLYRVLITTLHACVGLSYVDCEVVILQGFTVLPAPEIVQDDVGEIGVVALLTLI